MHQIDIPLDYKSNLRHFFRKDRNRWIFEYHLPAKDGRVSTSLTLASTYTEKMDSVVKKLANKKREELAKGLVTKREYNRILKKNRFLPISFSEAVEIFHNLADTEKNRRTIRVEKLHLRLAGKFFEEELNLKSFSEILEQHIILYKDFLLSEKKKRIEAEAHFNSLKKMAKSKEEEYAFDRKLKKVGISPATARSYFKTLKTLFSRLHKNKKIPANPAKEVESIKISQSRKTRSKSYKIDEIVSILNAPYKHREGFPIKEFFELILETGARYLEALCLEWTDIDFKNKVWRIQEKPLCPSPYGMGFRPKHGKSREVLLTKRAIEILDSIPQRESVGYIPKDNTPYSANFVFTSKDLRKNYSKTKPLWCRPNSIKRSWASLLKSAGLDYEGINKNCLHDLRRFKNEFDRHVNKISDSERSRNLGHGERVNKEHYSAGFDNIVIGLNDEISSLKRKIFILETELEQFKNKAEIKKGSSKDPLY